MAENPTTGELYKVKAILEDEVVAAVDVFMRDPTVSLFRFNDGHTLDVAAAVKAHPWAKATVASQEASEHLRRAAVRTAILLARPVKP